LTWAGYIKLFGNNAPIQNDYAPKCFHIHHGISSVTSECSERDWNEKTMKENVLDTLMNNVMFVHLKKNLVRRTPWGGFLVPTSDEKRIEQEFFDMLSVVNPIHKLEYKGPPAPEEQDYV